MHLPLVLLIVLQPDPEDVFRKMCKALDEARSVRFDATAELKQEQDAATGSTSLRLRGDRARLDLRVTRAGKTRDVHLAFEKGFCLEKEGDTQLPAEDVHRDTVRRLQSALARTGVFGFTFIANSAKYAKKTRNDVPDLSGLSCSEFAAGGEEAVGERKAWKISYRAALKDSGLDPLAVTVWVDQERYVPLKRTVSVTERGRAVSIVETVTRFELNPEINDVDLALPEK